MHIGHASSSLSQQVLSDSLQVLMWLLPSVASVASPNEFFGGRFDVVTGLLDQRRSEIEHAVARKLERGRATYQQLVETLGGKELLHDTLGAMESRQQHRMEQLKEPPSWTSSATCPACQCEAALLGSVSFDAEAAIEYEDGEPHFEAWWNFFFTPEALQCAVCRLSLNGPEELATAGAPSQTFQLNEIGAELDELLMWANETAP